MSRASKTIKEKVHVARIRWMIRLDMSEVMAIEKLSFEHEWSEEDFWKCLRQRRVVGMVAERGEKIIGFMIYEVAKTSLRLLNLAVHPEYRRTMVGSQMVDKLIDKLPAHRRTQIVADVRETNLVAQLFFRDMKFQAVRVKRGFYLDSGEDAFLMGYVCESWEI